MNSIDSIATVSTTPFAHLRRHTHTRHFIRHCPCIVFLDRHFRFRAQRHTGGTRVLGQATTTSKLSLLEHLLKIFNVIDLIRNRIAGINRQNLPICSYTAPESVFPHCVPLPQHTAARVKHPSNPLAFTYRLSLTCFGFADCSREK